ncbi:hypothetical protein Ae201684_015438 [Aphanomyces euteiches]|uniref:DNA-directed primase/polymerase protein n=1 Tax=Aphanomyces euteiches TaxID=100861 RepID=A0A6G0WGQ8_9STRA|nr:hypothetical protein Ae201684_015438 [Aphanomyces euteiches]
MNNAFESEFQYRVQNSIDCQIEGTAKPNKVFALQQPAIDFLREIQTRRSAHNIKLFSFETKTSRKFLVSDIDLFYDLYMQTSPTQRHVYEIIQENCPCRLYFDLEFKTKWNPTVDGDALVSHLKHLVTLQFYRKYGIQIFPTDFVDLESTATDKFSRHLIVIPPNGELFINNIEAGQFVKELMDDIMEPDIFEVTGKDQALQCFIDKGVYTRNRAFRCYLSSKFHSDRLLQRHPNCATLAGSEKEFFMKTMICPRVNENSHPLLLRCPVSETNSVLRRATSTVSTSISTGYLSSPFEAIDEFVLSLATQDGVQGCIRTWQLAHDETDQPQFLTYHMVQNRYCRNVGRAHKSNNIMYIVDFCKRIVYQKCHDPDCSDYKSPPIQLPSSCILQIDEAKQNANEEHTG